MMLTIACKTYKADVIRVGIRCCAGLRAKKDQRVRLSCSFTCSQTASFSKLPGPHLAHPAAADLNEVLQELASELPMAAKLPPARSLLTNKGQCRS